MRPRTTLHPRAGSPSGGRLLSSLVAILAVAGLWGCASSSEEPTPAEARTSPDEHVYSDPGDLVDRGLGPRLTQILQSDPWLEDRPFVVVPFAGTQRREEIDGLTRVIRRNLEEHLLGAAGVRLRHLHPVSRPEQPHRPEIAGCDHRGTDFDMLLGLDLSQEDDRRMSLLVKAIDLDSGELLPLALRFTFRVTAAELELFFARSPDEAVTGTRLAPFSGQGKDEVARFLAHNLSCVGQLGGSTVFLDSTRLETRFDSDIVDLVGHYLQALDPVEILDSDPADPDVATLQAEAWDDGPVRILWISGPYRLSARAYYRSQTPAPTRWVATGRASWPEQRGATEAERRIQAALVAEARALAELARRFSDVEVFASQLTDDGSLAAETVETRVQTALRTMPVGEPSYDERTRTVEVTRAIDPAWLAALEGGDGR